MARRWKLLFYKSQLIAFACAVLFNVAAFAASDAGITYQGRILKPDGSPLTGATVQFRLQIRTPGSQNCLMFEEVQTQDMRNSNGIFSLTMNDGSGTRTDATAFGLDRVFANRGSFTFDPATCSTGSTYSPNADDGRKLVVYFKDETMSSWEPMPAQNINFVPFALETKQIAGFGIQNLLRVEEADGTLTNITPLSNANYDALKLLVAGTSGLYERAGRLGGSTITGTPAAGQVLSYNGTSWTPVTPAASSGGTVTSVTAGTGLATTPAGGITGAGSIGLATLGAGGTGFKVTYDTYGRVTAAVALVEADIPTLTSTGKVAGSAINGTIANGTVINTTGAITGGSFTTTGALSAGSISSTGAISAGGLISSSAGTFTALGTNDLQIFKNATDKVSITAPTGLVAPGYSLTLPTTAGGANQVLTTNGSGVLSWTNPISASGAFVNDGNSFAGAATLGTNDNNVLNFETNGTTKMTILANGNVGVGTASPTMKLDVQGSAYISDISTTQVSTAQSGPSVFPANHITAFSDSGRPQLNLVRTRGTYAAQTAVNNNDELGLLQGSGHNGTQTESAAGIKFITDGTNVTGSGNHPGGRIEFLTRGTTDATQYGLTPVMTINNSGNVGIGTTAPSALLEVAGLAKANGFQVGTIGFISSSTSAETRITNGWGNGYINFFTNNGTTTAERMRITGSGNVGIGTTSPQAALDVAGAIRVGTSTTCGAPTAGSIRYNTGNLEYCNGSGWQVLGVAGAGISALTGDVTASGTGSVAATIAANAVTSAKIADGTIATADLADKSVTLAKIQDIPTASLIGRATAATGVPEVITIGSGLSLTGTTLSASGTDSFAALPCANGYVPYKNTTWTCREATAANTNDTIVARDSAGSFIANNATLNSVSFKNASSQVVMQSPLGANYTFTLPGNAGTSGYVLSTNGSGTTSWVDLSTSLGQWTKSSNNIYYNVAGGNVGVGTAAPLGKFSIKQETDAELSGLYLQRSSNADTWSQFVGNNGRLHFANALSATGADAAADFNTRMVIDNSGNVGIGTTSPLEKLHVVGDGAVATIGATVYGASYVPALKTAKARGTEALPTIVADSDTVMKFQGIGYDGALWRTAAQIVAQVDGTPGAGDMPGRLTFETTPDGASNPLERMRINSLGDVGIGTTSPTRTLDVRGGGITLKNASTAVVSSESFNGTDFPRMTVTRGNCGSTGVCNAGNGQVMGQFDFTTKTQNLIGAAIRAVATEAQTDSTFGSNMSFHTVPTGTNTLLERMTILNNGNVGIGTTNPGTLLQVGTGATRYTAIGTTGKVATQYDVNAMTSVYQFNNAGITGVDQGVEIEFGLGRTGTANRQGAISMGAEADHSTAANRDSYMKFSTSLDGAESERVRISAAGNVGIGTTSPQAALDVAGAIRVGTSTTCGAPTAGSIRYNSTNLEYCNGSGWQVLGVAGAGITALTGDVTASGTGSVAATIAANAVTTAKIADANVTFAKMQNIPTASLIGRSTAATGAPESITLGTGLSMSGGVLSSSVTGSQWTTSGSNIHYSAAGGNVGIGTTTPGVGGVGVVSGATYLTVKGGTKSGNVQLMTGEADADGIAHGSLEWVDSTSAAMDTRAGYIQLSKSGTNASNNRGSMMAFATRPDSGSGPAERMRISNTGNVGINQTAPNGKLDVKGSIVMSGGTSGYTGFQPPAAAGSMIYTMPATNPTAGQVLTSTAAGVLSWTTVSAGGAAKIDDLSDAVANTAKSTVYLGLNAGGSSTGSFNTVTGHAAAPSLTTGGYNTVIGASAGTGLTTQTNNIAIGVETLYYPKLGTLGSNNVAVGNYALNNNAQPTGQNNTAIGQSALKGSTGSYNTAIGSESGLDATGGDSIFVGVGAGSGVTANNNIVLGYNSAWGVGGADNLVAGNYAFFANGGAQTGARNIYLGSRAAGDNIQKAGSQNLGIGVEALQYIQSGNNNIALGYQTGNTTTTGSNNILVGNGVTTPAANTSNFMNIGNSLYGDLANARIGIGTSTPYYKLDVIQSDLTASTEFQPLRVAQSTTGKGVYIAYQTNGAATDVTEGRVRTTGGIPLVLGTTTYPQAVTISNSNGGLGIGTSTPSAMLHLRKGAGTANARFESTTGRVYDISSETSGLFRIVDNASSNSLTFQGSTGNLGIGTGTTAAAEKLEVNGNVLATAYLYSSDRRLKKNILPIENALAKVLRLNGVTYKWRAPLNPDEDREQIGVIAQDVEAVFPQAVTISKDGTKRVNYPMLVAPVIEAIKDLKVDHDRKLASLEERAEKAEARVVELEKRNAEFEARLRALEASLRPAK